MAELPQQAAQKIKSAELWEAKVREIDAMTPEQQLREFGVQGDSAYATLLSTLSKGGRLKRGETWRQKVLDVAASERRIAEEIVGEARDRLAIKLPAKGRMKSETEGWIPVTILDFSDIVSRGPGGVITRGTIEQVQVRFEKGKHVGDVQWVAANFVEIEDARR